MYKYDYVNKVKEDVQNALFDYVTKDEIKEALKDNEAVNDLFFRLYDFMFDDDNVTGNPSGSYTCSAYQAEEYIAHNLDLLIDALDYYGETCLRALRKGAEYCDVTIRCYLLENAIKEVITEFKEELND